VKPFLLSLVGFAIVAVASAQTLKSEGLDQSSQAPTSLDLRRKKLSEPLHLEIESLSLSVEKPVPGETLEATAVIRNASGHTIDRAVVAFYQGDRQLGASVVIEGLEANGVANVVLPFRPSGIGRYSITLVAAPAATLGTTPDDLLSVQRASGVQYEKTFLINALPEWWSRLDKALQKADINGTPINYSRMQGLETHALCQNDIRAEMILQKHGQAILDGVLAGSQNQDNERFADAVNELAKFAEMLYCIDFTRLQYWDRAIASFWREIAEKPASDLTFDEAILATWNPALLVVDAIQITGHSEIIQVFQQLRRRIVKALKLYPVDTYGAALLDAFGTGQLVCLSGKEAIDNLSKVLAKPSMLGLGMCSLAAHAEKTAIDQPCFESLERVTTSCKSTELSDFLAELNEAAMLLPLVEGNLARASAAARADNAKAGAGGNAPQASGQPIAAVKFDELEYFGAPLASYAAGLCERLSTLKPRGLQGLASKFRASLARLDGCGFAMLMAGLSGPGGGFSSRVTQCLESSNTLIPSPIQKTQVRFPLPECGQGRSEDRRPRLRGYYARMVGLGGKKVKVQRYPSGRDVYSLETDTGKMTVNGDRKAGRVVSVDNTTRDAAGEFVESTTTIYRENGGEVTTKIKALGGGNKRVTETVKDGKGNIISKTTTTYDKDNKETKKSSNVPPKKKQSTRPKGPGEEGCGETAAQQRARARFNCIFSDPAVDIHATPIPVINPSGPGGGLPAACNAIDPGSFWGSSTGDGVYDPPSWRVGGGPAMFERFIPEIDGVIDPPKDWMFIPGRERLPR